MKRDYKLKLWWLQSIKQRNLDHRKIILPYSESSAGSSYTTLFLDSLSEFVILFPKKQISKYGIFLHDHLVKIFCVNDYSIFTVFQFVIGYLFLRSLTKLTIFFQDQLPKFAFFPSSNQQIDFRCSTKENKKIGLPWKLNNYSKKNHMPLKELKGLRNTRLHFFYVV